MRKILLANAVALSTLYAPIAIAGEWGVEVSSLYVSEYADRGTTVAGQQIQSNVTLTNGAFSTGITYARTLGDDRLVYDDEIDINIDYGLELAAGTSLNIGADLIHVPGAGGLFDIGAADASPIEVYAGLSFDKAFAPSLTAIYDVQLNDFTMEATASHSIEISEQSELVFDIIGGYAAIAGADDILYLTAGTTYNHALGENLTATAGAFAGLSSEPTFTDANFPAGLPPIIKTSASSAWIQIGLMASF
jgi:hypothetical protein